MKELAPPIGLALSVAWATACSATLPGHDELAGGLPDPCGPDLIAHWAFEDPPGNAVVDSSPNRRDGTSNGGVSTQGKFGAALHFDGKGNVVIREPISTTAGITMSAWVKLDSLPVVLPDNDYFSVCLLGAQAELSFGYHWMYFSAISLRWQYSGSSGRIVKNRPLGGWELGRWYHVAISHDYVTKLISFYRDGEILVEAVAHSDTVVPAMRRTAVLAGQLDGALDEVQICGRALSAAEIRSAGGL